MSWVEGDKKGELDALHKHSAENAHAIEQARFIWSLRDSGVQPDPSVMQIIKVDDVPRRVDGASTWICVLAPTATFAPGGLSQLIEAARSADPDIVAIYADDLAIAGKRTTLRQKCAYDPLLLRSLDYLGGAVVWRREALSANNLADLREGASSAAVMREVEVGKVGHLPYPATILSEAPTPSLAPSGPYRPHVSVVIPNRDSPELIQKAVGGVLNDTTYDQLELVIVDNGSENAETLAFYDRLAGDARVTVDISPAPFNFSRMINRGVAMASGEAILLLNNDVEIIHDDWLSAMTDTLAEAKMGVVGAKLLFPDQSIQHAGVIVGHGGVAGHDLKGAPRNAAGLLGRMAVPHERNAVTAAAMLMRKQLWTELGGFDPNAFPIAFNDVDFCLRARASGWRVALQPNAELIHRESVSRRASFSIQRYLEHRRERAALRQRHGTIRHTDRFESPWRDPEDLRGGSRRLDYLPGLRL